ncbi:MAG: hypothetical protein OQK12_05640 [Motiliproteus sp.]|nr:hypothetical protein [Motiliproteus sp.]MCW9052114.1 hypothetical protein [Motiliproteus sp.]
MLRVILALSLFCFPAMSLSATVSEGQIRVAIIDKFFPPQGGFQDEDHRRSSNWLYGLVDLDQDDEREPYYHGDMVHLIAAHPRFSFHHYPMRNNAQPLEEILVNLKKIDASMPYRPIDALILSWESSTLISSFEKPLRRQNVGIYRWQLKQWGLSTRSWQATEEIIEMLEILADQNIQIFTIAGNGGRGMVNTFSFARGVTTVGAKEPELSHFIADNSFVDLYEQAAYTITRVDDNDGTPLGYDVDGDGCADIPLERLSGQQKQQKTTEGLPKTAWKPIKGSSFAAPMAFKKTMLAKNSIGNIADHRRCTLLAANSQLK